MPSYTNIQYYCVVHGALCFPAFLPCLRLVRSTEYSHLLFNELKQYFGPFILLDLWNNEFLVHLKKSKLFRSKILIFCWASKKFRVLSQTSSATKRAEICIFLKEMQICLSGLAFNYSISKQLFQVGFGKLKKNGVLTYLFTQSH